MATTRDDDKQQVITTSLDQEMTRGTIGVYRTHTFIYTPG